MTYKQPVSVLVLVYTEELDVLLLERADFPGHWQSVTGSREAGEPLALTAVLGRLAGLGGSRRFREADQGRDQSRQIALDLGVVDHAGGGQRLVGP